MAARRIRESRTAAPSRASDRRHDGALRRSRHRDAGAVRDKSRGIRAIVPYRLAFRKTQRPGKGNQKLRGSSTRLAKKEQMWDHPIVTIKADNKKRVVVPDARPGDVFAYEDQGNGHFHLVRLIMPDPPQRKTRAQVRKAIANSRLKFDVSWDELRELVREP
jgi:hypothetical protein